MRKWWSILCALGVVLCINSLVFANVITTLSFVQIDDERFPIVVEEVKADEVTAKDLNISVGKIMFQILEQTFTTVNPNGGTVTVSGLGNPDPSLTSSMTSTDLGDPSTFHMVFSIPIIFPAAPSTVMATIGGAVIDSSFGVNGAMLTPVAPLTLLPVDTDGVTETLVSVASNPSSVNLGVDIGLAMTVSPPSIVMPYGPFMTGPQNGPSGPFTTLAHEYSFMLSGGGDTASLVAGTLLVPNLPAAVPEPSTWFLLATGCLGLLGYGWWRRPRAA